MSSQTSLASSSTQANIPERIHVLRIHQRFDHDLYNYANSENSSEFRSREDPESIDTSEDTPEQNRENSPSTGVALYLPEEGMETFEDDPEDDSKKGLESASVLLPHRLHLTHSKSKNRRSRSAPPRPLTELEELRSSYEFECLESSALSLNRLVYKEDESLDLESFSGYYLCGKYLESIQKLSLALHIIPCNREYRKKFSQPYKTLYDEHRSFSYLTEILDSAQEGLPCITINSENYVFSSSVLRYGKQLLFAFLKLKDLISNVYSRFCEDGLNCKDMAKLFDNMKRCLKNFDKCWVEFERIYVFELMIIEKDARRLVMQGIELDRLMRNYETSEKLKGTVVIKASSYDILRLNAIKSSQQCSTI